MKTCSIDGCEKMFYARGWCNMHYTRWRIHGGPLAGGTRYDTPEESFLARVAWDGEHLIWTGSLNTAGYGSLRANGRMVKAHRYAWERERGPIPEGAFIDHKCWTPACVLVDHLRVASPSDNARNLSGAHSDRKHDLPRGVTINGRGYRARISVNDKELSFGTFPTIEAASEAAATARAIHFGIYAGGN